MGYIAWIEELSKKDAPVAGGKGANLGELTRAGLPVPPGFVVMVDAFKAFIQENALAKVIEDQLASLPVDDQAALHAAAEKLQAKIRRAAIPAQVRSALAEAYRELGRRAKVFGDPRVAVRSSATVEDSASASFAGMFKSFLNVESEQDLANAVRECWASSFAARVLFYRLKQQQIAHENLLAVVVQRMVSADKAGVMFTVDPASADPGLMVIESSWGLGETVVGGQVEPDHFVVRKNDLSLINRAIAEKSVELVRDPKTRQNREQPVSAERRSAPSLTIEEVRAVAELGVRAERHYGAPQDLEFAIEADRVFLVQSRPVTAPSAATKPAGTGDVLVRGMGASPGRATGRVRVLRSPEQGRRLEPGEILVAPVTTPDWVPFMRKAAAIVTDSGGMTSHAAIVSRELGVPCVVGTRKATTVLSDGMSVTADGKEGTVYAGEVTQAPLRSQAAGAGADLVTATRLYVNLGEPARAAEVAAMPVDGVGLLRAEFLILEALQGVHPRLLLERGQSSAFVDRLTQGIEQLARAFHPRPVVYRTMDFRTNEFRGLEGGERFEPVEANPMIGYRGCYRYVREPDLFGLELKALRAVRGRFDNVHAMLPFVRTAAELEECRRQLDAAGLAPNGRFQLWVMAEVPSAAHWIARYAELGVTGVSIGSNDLTQLMLGVDRDSELLAQAFDERDGAVLAMIRRILRASQRAGLTTSICGQAPSVHPDYAERLVHWGIDSISVTPDAVDSTRRNILAAERRLVLRRTTARRAVRRRAARR